MRGVRDGHSGDCEETEVIRNLIVHCYPRKSGMWRNTLKSLTAGRRWEQFTGRKIISIVYDDCCSEPDDVADEWPAECEFSIIPNTAMQEVESFLPLLSEIESRDSDEFTTYVHCKGATQPADHASHLWCDGMATASLDYPQLLECCFSRGANICGAFRSHGLWSFPGYHNWHFAGTWFTFRHSRIFGELDWRNINQNFMGVEAWPGIVPVAESACLFFDNANTAHLYSHEFWRDNVNPSLKWWHKSLAKCGLMPLFEKAQSIPSLGITERLSECLHLPLHVAKQSAADGPAGDSAKANGGCQHDGPKEKPKAFVDGLLHVE